MIPESKDVLLALLGLLLILYGCGMAVFAVRNQPRGLGHALFKPRWRYGVEASRSAAVVQVPLHVTLGTFMLLRAFHSVHAGIFGALSLVFGMFAACMFFVDAMPDES